MKDFFSLHHKEATKTNQSVLWINRGYITFESVLKIVKLLFRVRSSWARTRYISTSWNYFGKSLLIDLPLTNRFVYT